MNRETALLDAAVLLLAGPMMTRAERREHHDPMMSMTDVAICSARMAWHHARMSRHDACEGLNEK